MDNLSAFITLVLLSLLVLALLALSVVGYAYYRSRSRSQAWLDNRAQEVFRIWQQREIEGVRAQQQQIAQSEAEVAFRSWKAEFEQAIRQDAIKRSESVTVGKITEHIVPFLPDFTYNPKDARFIGSPIDLIVFDGLSDGEVKKVVFLEIKTGLGSLSTRERRVRDAIEAGNVAWSVLQLNMAPEAHPNGGLGEPQPAEQLGGARDPRQDLLPTG
jgi:predicted Holliday junction resolvase-like endonuclease